MYRRSTATALAGTAFLLAGSVTAPVAAADAAAAPDLRRFYQQTLAWGDCEGVETEKGGDALKGMQCARLTVPVDYANPGLGTLALAVGRYRAASPGGRGLGSLVFNFGGPGASGLTTLAAAKDSYKSLGNRYDLVSFDPRGVGRSSPVRCGKEAEKELAEGVGVPRTTPGGPLDHGETVRELKDIATACATHTGKLLPHVGTINVSRDLDVLRQALGERKLNYLGLSYGTRLGAVYAGQFPDRAGRLVLDAVDTLTEGPAASALNQARAFQQGFDAFLAACAKHGKSCPLGETATEAAGSVDRVVGRLTRAPAKAPDGKPFRVDDLRGAMGTALYSAEAWPALALGIAMIDQDDDPSLLAELNRLTKDDGNAAEALLAVNCADEPDRILLSRDELAKIEKQFTAASPTFGRDLMGGAISCTGWPAGTDHIRKLEKITGPEVLMIGTRGDPATPYRWTEETAKRLGKAVVLRYEGEGHGAYSVSPCVRVQADAYLLDGKLPPTGTSCPAVPQGAPDPDETELPETLPGA